MEAAVHGTTVHYELTGQGDRRVVLLHGWGASTELMKATADFLSADMRVLNLDFPGHGKSGRPPEPWGVPDYAACIAELLTGLDFLPCDVIAHSFGGRVAIWLASEDSSRFGRIVLTGAAGIRAPQTGEQKKRSEEFRRLKKVAGIVRKVGFLSGAADKMEEDLRRKYGSADYNALDEEMRKTFVRVVNQDLTEKLPDIHCPTLLMWGDKDTATPLWMGQKMDEMIPDSGLVVMKDGSHFAYLEQNAWFNRVVHHFLMEE